MENDKPLRWKLKLTAELARGECVEYDVTGWERGAEVTLGFLGLSIAEGKAILAEIQTHMIATQIEGPNCGLWRGSSLLRSMPGGDCRTKATTAPHSGPCSATCPCGFGA